MRCELMFAGNQREPASALPEAAEGAFSTVD